MLHPDFFFKQTDIDIKPLTNELQGGCWDTEGSMGYFPHIHGNGLKLGREEVDEVGEWVRGDGEWGAAGWPFGEEDVPTA
jgi:hypothetical protein